MLLQCSACPCHHQASLIAGTVFEASKPPLTTWFLALFFLSPSKNNVSALSLGSHLGVCYRTAWEMKHKLPDTRAEAEATRVLVGRVAVDDAYLGGDGRHYRLVVREVRHRMLGANAVPDEAWIDSLDDALVLIGKTREARRFTELVSLTAERQPALLPWLAKRPLKGLELAGDWLLLLEVAAWLQAQPRPGIYPRQVDMPGVHSKFIEGQRGMLAKLLDLALPPEAVDTTVSGITLFCRRYGFRDKALRIRFRVLDPWLALAAYSCRAGHHGRSGHVQPPRSTGTRGVHHRK